MFWTWLLTVLGSAAVVLLLAIALDSIPDETIPERGQQKAPGHSNTASRI